VLQNKCTKIKVFLRSIHPIVQSDTQTGLGAGQPAGRPDQGGKSDTKREVNRPVSAWLFHSCSACCARPVSSHLRFEAASCCCCCCCGSCRSADGRPAGRRGEVVKIYHARTVRKSSIWNQCVHKMCLVMVMVMECCVALIRGTTPR
jgi:hypothetical protein